MAVEGSVARYPGLSRGRGRNAATCRVRPRPDMDMAVGRVSPGRTMSRSRLSLAQQSYPSS